MKSELEKLIERVNCLASKRGSRAELASFLKVFPGRVSEWLSGKSKPGGDVTLRLLAWAEQEEKKQKCVGSVSSTTNAQAQKTEITTNEKRLQNLLRQ